MAKASGYDKSADVVHFEKTCKTTDGTRLKVRVRSYDGGELKIVVEQIPEGKKNGFALKRLTAGQFNAACEAMADCAAWIEKQPVAEKPAEEKKTKAA